jgi:hypothetical protein
LGGSRDNALEKLQDEIQRLRKAMRENTTLDERVRRSIEWDLIEIITDEKPEDDDEEGARAALSDLDAKKLDRVTDLIKELGANLLCVAPPWRRADAAIITTGCGEKHAIGTGKW